MFENMQNAPLGGILNKNIENLPLGDLWLCCLIVRPKDVDYKLTASNFT